MDPEEDPRNQLQREGFTYVVIVIVLKYYKQTIYLINHFTYMNLNIYVVEHCVYVVGSPIKERAKHLIHQL